MNRLRMEVPDVEQALQKPSDGLHGTKRHLEAGVLILLVKQLLVPHLVTGWQAADTHHQVALDPLFLLRATRCAWATAEVALSYQA